MKIDPNSIEADMDPILRFFVPNPNLPQHLLVISEQFEQMAAEMLIIPRNAERTAGFRKLLEAKDCFVRAAL